MSMPQGNPNHDPATGRFTGPLPAGLHERATASLQRAVQNEQQFWDSANSDAKPDEPQWTVRQAASDYDRKLVAIIQDQTGRIGDVDYHKRLGQNGEWEIVPSHFLDRDS